MNTASPQAAQVLARRLEQDIRSRGLRVGDRYLTSEQAAEMLDVSAGTAHQAMKILADRDVLQRRRKSGTFVGPAVVSTVVPRMRVHVLTGPDAPRDPTSNYLSEPFLTAVSLGLRNAAVQIDMIPPGEGLLFVRRLVEEAVRRGDLGGFILIRCSYEIQRFFAGAHLPAVVKGSVYPGIDLPWVDEDHGEVGRLTAEHVLHEGHRRLAVLMYERWAPGDVRFMSGFNKAMERSGRRVEHVEICSLPSCEIAIRCALEELMSGSNPPTAIINRSALHAKVAMDVVESHAWKAARNIALVMGNLGCGALAHPIPHAASDNNPHNEGQLFAKMLDAMRAGREPETHHVVVPVRYEKA